MLKLLKTWFLPDPNKKLMKLRDKKYKEAVALQRNGDLRGYGKVMKEIEDIENVLVNTTQEE